MNKEQIKNSSKFTDGILSKLHKERKRRGCMGRRRPQYAGNFYMKYSCIHSTHFICQYFYTPFVSICQYFQIVNPGMNPALAQKGIGG